MIKLKNPKISMLVNFDSTTIELFDSKSSKTFTREKAQELLDKYNYHYLVLGDEIVAEITCKPETLEPDWNKMIDYEIIQNN